MSTSKYIMPILMLLLTSVFMPVTVHAQESDKKAEERQMVEDMSPRGQYRLSQKEANAAYQEALAGCRKMKDADRASCMKEARQNRQADLAEAQKALTSGK